MAVTATEPDLSKILEAEARYLLDAANAEPEQVLGQGLILVERARDSKAPRAGIIAQRAMGLAAAEMGQLDPALRHLETARRSARDLGDSALLGEVETTLAVALMWSGRSEAAMKTIDQAVARLRGVARARARAQRATILNRAGRSDEALAEFNAALVRLRAEGDTVWQGHCLSNRAIIRAQRGDTIAAEADLVEARRLYRERSHSSAVAEMTHNIGWVAGVAGDIPKALAFFDEAEEGFRRLRYPLGEPLRDRSRVLASAQLTSEARAAAGRAVDLLGSGGMAVARAEALLELSVASLLDGDPAGALAAATEAERSFRRQRRDAFAAQAVTAELAARSHLGTVRVGQVRRMADAIETLERSGMRTAAWRARLLSAGAALDIDRPELAQTFLRDRQRLRRATVELRIGAASVEARLLAAQGDRHGAVRRARAALRLLDEYRATLGAAETRAHLAAHARPAAQLGLRIAVEDGDARSIFAWVERTRAGGLRFPPVRPPDDAMLGRELAELRVVEGRIALAERQGTSVPELRLARIRLQESIRRRTRRVAGTGRMRSAPASVPDVLAALDGRTLVEIGDIDGQSIAIVVSRGVARRRWLGPTEPVSAAVSHLRTALRRIANPAASEASVAAAAAVVDEARRVLDETLVAPLRLEEGEVVVVPPPALQSVPWGMLPGLWGLPVTVSPSARIWIDRQRNRVPGRVLLASGPRLPAAAAETRALHGIHPDAVRLTSRLATADAVLEGIDGAELAHVVCHGVFRADNPLFSSLELSGGGLFVYDLERLRRPPCTMVLSACDLGLPAARPGDEVLGVVAALLGAGTSSVIASAGLVPDAALTRRVMMALHRRLAEGERPAPALAGALRGLDPSDPASILASCFVCFGAG